ncbi:MAG TPA: Mut7-C RNAse domain-containing protein [Terriglobales bacterium]|nr:Mut7-C RNAse domain-containing protein [Terriglobales bacterium]
MQQAHFRFYAELNDLLPAVKRERCFSHSFEMPATVKDTIEAFGIPHTEVDLILANGKPEGFSYLVRDGDRIGVYPVFRSLDLGLITRLQPRLEGEMRFVLDTHLGKLAAYLRMLGFDSVYRNDCQDEELAQMSACEQRILLSRDRGLLKRSVVTRGYLVRAAQPRQQLVEVLRRFGLSESIAPFHRCLYCNTLLEPVSKGLISHRLPPGTKKYYDEFHWCPGCNRLYWKGSHHQRMVSVIDRITNSVELE